MLYRGNVLFARQSEISLREPMTRSNSIRCRHGWDGFQIVKEQ